MPIDLHAHYVPATLVDALRARRDPPRIARLADGSEVLHLPVGRLAFGPEYTNMAARRGFMDRHGVDRQILSFPRRHEHEDVERVHAERLREVVYLV